MQNKDRVTIHACERFNERVMGIKTEEGSLAKKALLGISRMIVTMMNETHPGWEGQPAGAYVCSEYGAKFKTKEGVVITAMKNDRKIYQKTKDGRGHNET